MDGLFPLALFPEGALSSSVITTVWVGVMVTAFFNLRLGWILSGLVVPGYLVPLLLLKPVAAGVVLVEGVVTYTLVWFYSEYLSFRLGWWGRLFGRDRFFALVLCSILVRVVGDGWLLPIWGEALNQRWGLNFDYRNNLHSFGLIIISLIANNFWKTGFWRGWIPQVVVIGVTYLLVRFGLMELTNFSIGNLGYTYEDMATAILSSPKAYIILITTAFLASRMNLHYGWDFNGILIPSLLALQWYEPGKIVASFVEAGIILLLGYGAMALPLFRHVTIEGGRKLLLFFNIGFAYKIALGYALLHWAPQVKITDYFGFGYLLSTLIAIKMHDKGIFARLTRATLQTSLTAVAGASVVGFALTFLPNVWLDQPAIQETPHRPRLASETPLPTMIEAIRADKVALYRTRFHDSMVLPLPLELEAFHMAFQDLARYLENKQEETLQRAITRLEGLNYQVDRLEGRYLYLREKNPRRGWGIFLLNLEPRSSLTVEVPAPLEEAHALEAGAWLFATLEAKALAVAGAMREANKDRSSDVLTNPRTPFQIFHRVIGHRDVLQLRTYTEESARLMGGLRRGSGDVTIPAPESGLWVKSQLPAGLDLTRMRQLLDAMPVIWADTPMANLQRESTSSGFAEWILNSADARKVLARSRFAGRDPALHVQQVSIEGYLQEWLLTDNKQRIAASGTDLYKPPTVEDLLYFEAEILIPLLQLARNEYRDDGWTTAGLEGLQQVSSAAEVMGYEVSRYHHLDTGQDYLILSERDGPQRRYWGLYLFRLGEAGHYTVEVPRPRFEVNTLEAAVSLFGKLKARALLVGGASPLTNADHSADILRYDAKVNLFNLVHQTLMREVGATPFLVVQARGLAFREGVPPPEADLLLAFDQGIHQADRLSPLGTRLLRSLEEMGLQAQLVDGSPATAGYEAASTFRTLALRQTINKELVVAWFSPLARAGFRHQGENETQLALFDALGVTTRRANLVTTLEAALETTRAMVPIPREMQTLLTRFIATQDSVLLQEARQRWPHWRWERILDPNTLLAALLILDGDGRPVAVWNGQGDLSGRAVVLKGFPSVRAAVQHFLESRAAWLVGGGS